MRLATIGRLRVDLKLEPRDIWIGAFADTDKQRLYLCALPCLPLVISKIDPCEYCEDAGWFWAEGFFGTDTWHEKVVACDCPCGRRYAAESVTS